MSEQQIADVSMDAYVKARTAGETPVEKPAATTPQEKVETAPESASGTPESGEESKSKGGGFQRRIDKLTKRSTELEESLQAEREARQRLEAKLAGRDPAELKAKTSTEQGPRPEPDIKDPKYQGEDGWRLYEKDVRAWDREQTRLETLKEVEARSKKETELSQAQQQEQIIRESFQKKGAETKEKHPDFDEVVMHEESEYNAKVKAGSVIDEFVIDPENNGPEVVYYLCKNPGEIDRIAALSPQKQIRELGKIDEIVSAKEEESSSPEPKKTSLPAPIKPLSTSTSKSAAKPENMSMADYAKWRTANRAR